MKIKNILALLLLAAALEGCESAGFAPESAPDLITPTVDAQTTVRRWDAAGRPAEQVVPNEPALNQ